MEEADRVAALHEAFLDVADFQTIQCRHELLIFLLQKKRREQVEYKSFVDWIVPSLISLACKCISHQLDFTSFLIRLYLVFESGF